MEKRTVGFVIEGRHIIPDENVKGGWCYEVPGFDFWGNEYTAYYELGDGDTSRFPQWRDPYKVVNKTTGAECTDSVQIHPALYEFIRYSDRGGIGDQKFYLYEPSAVEAARDEWNHLSERDKRDFLEDKGALWQVVLSFVTLEEQPDGRFVWAEDLNVDPITGTPPAWNCGEPWIKDICDVLGEEREREKRERADRHRRDDAR